MKASSLLSLILAMALVIVCGKMAIGGNSKDGTVSVADSTGNPVIDNIMTRASVRAFQSKAVEDGKVDTLLKAGMAAPTAADKRPWHFVVVTDKDQLKAIAKTNPNGGFAGEAPLAIVVCGDMRKTLEGSARDFWVQDASAATENILLAAHGLGLGAVWVGFYPDKDKCGALSQLLELPAEVIPMSMVVAGYAAQQPKVKDKWDEANVSYDAYDGE